MARNKVSAIPDRLDSYAERATEMDAELLSDATALRSRLEHFEARCTEPGFTVHASGLVDPVRLLADACDAVDRLVGNVARGFRMADSRWGSYRTSSHRLGFEPPGSTGTARVTQSVTSGSWSLGPIPVPGWLIGILPLLTWIQRISVLPSAEPGTHDLSGPRPRSRLGELLDRDSEADSQDEAARHVDAQPERRSRFGELLVEEDESDSTEEAHAPPSKPEIETRPETKPVDAAAEDGWGWDVPAKSQEGLRYRDTVTGFGCTPTATSMILDYWHTKDPTRNATMSAQALLDRNVAQGEFNPEKGLSPDKILDEVQGLGGYQTDVSTNANLDQLRKAVSQGPVLAVVKSKVSSKPPRSSTLSSTGAVHSVVVTGISEDGQQVRINDPWNGRSETYSWGEFSKAWGADFGEKEPGVSFPSNIFVVIGPSKR